MKARTCKDCGEDTRGNLSTHGLCPDCSWNRQKEAQRQIKERKGPIYEKWKARLKASAESL